MRLCSYRDGRLAERVAVVDEDRGVPASDLVPGGPRTMGELIAGGDDGLSAIRNAADPERIRSDGRPLAELELLAPVPRPGKIVAIGRNYREHAAEEGAEQPVAPLIFAKFASSVIGPGDDVRWDPTLTSQVDYEAELAVIIGKRTRGVPVERAIEFVFGYTCLNDVSARALQFADGQWTRGKSLDTFCPIGPRVVSREEIGDPQALRIRCRLNGETVQDASTADMIFGIAELVAFVSETITLEAGDVIATGTPPGVAFGRAEPRYLQGGDTVEV